MAGNNAINANQTGIQSFDGTSTFNGRTISAGSSKLTVSNGNGVSGNPSIDAVEANFTLNNIGGTLGETKGGTGQTTYATGDILYASASNTLSKLAAGSDGEVLTLASGIPSWAAGGGGGGGVDPTTDMVFYEDFHFDTTLFESKVQWTSTGGTWNASADMETGHPGLVKINASSASTFGVKVDAGGATDYGIFKFGGGEITIEWDIKIPELSGTGGGFDTYDITVGMVNHDASFNPSSIDDGVGFTYTHSVNSGNWVLFSESSTTRSTSNTSSAVAANTWYRLTIVVNAAASSISYFVDGTSVGSAITTNIPTIGLVPYFGINKAFGTANRNFKADYFYAKQTFTTAR